MADTLHRRRPADIHAADCTCPACEPYTPSTAPSLADAAALTAAQLALGIGLAAAIVAALQAATGGPGIGVVFGL